MARARQGAVAGQSKSHLRPGMNPIPKGPSEASTPQGAAFEHAAHETEGHETKGHETKGHETEGHETERHETFMFLI